MESLYLTLNTLDKNDLSYIDFTSRSFKFEIISITWPIPLSKDIPIVVKSDIFDLCNYVYFNTASVYSGYCIVSSYPETFVKQDIQRPNSNVRLNQVILQLYDINLNPLININMEIILKFSFY